MPIVDADTHVDENEETWEYLLPEHRPFKPITVAPPAEALEDGVAPRGYTRFWNIDGVLRVRRIRDDDRTGTVEAARELTDVAARIRHMDQLGTDVQVMYPTLFLTAVTARPEVEYALCRAYNRWLGAKSDESGGRLRWVVVPPTLSMNKALEEITWGKEHGACGVFKRGIEVGRSAHDPYFFPLYRHAADLDIPLCIHIASHDPAVSDALMSHLTLYNFSLSPIDAFVSMVTGGIPAMFPKLRIGFIETMASWIPFAMADLEARHQRTAWMAKFDYSRNLMKDGNFYVACQTHEDLAYILQYTGPDQLLIGSDYTHADQSAELKALDHLRARTDIDSLITTKIVSDNPSKFYGID